MSEVYKSLENVAKGFWVRHKGCVLGGAALLATGFVLGLLA